MRLDRLLADGYSPLRLLTLFEADLGAAFDAPAGGRPKLHDRRAHARGPVSRRTRLRLAGPAGEPCPGRLPADAAAARHRQARGDRQRRQAPSARLQPRHRRPGHARSASTPAPSRSRRPSSGTFRWGLCSPTATSTERRHLHSAAVTANMRVGRMLTVFSVYFRCEAGSSTRAGAGAGKPGLDGLFRFDPPSGRLDFAEPPPGGCAGSNARSGWRPVDGGRRPVTASALAGRPRSPRARWPRRAACPPRCSSCR